MKSFSLLVILLLIVQIMGRHFWASTILAPSTIGFNNGLGKMCMIRSPVCVPGTPACGYFGNGMRQTFQSECHACANPGVTYTTVGSCPFW
jgi:hypothetical protein